VSSDSKGYTQTPDGGDSATYEATDASAEGEAAESVADWKGTVLVVAVTLATLVIPCVIYLYPALLADRVPFLVAMLALPVAPAVLLGVVAVWAMKE
jgi:archaellum biogenesis protein FlaJ (TadC family)